MEDLQQKDSDSEPDILAAAPAPSGISMVGVPPKPDNVLRSLVGAVAIGIWALVYQNVSGPTAKPVEVVNTVGVRGSVDVQNRVDINISAIAGYNDVFYNSPYRDPAGKYFRLPIASP